jgi:hypothetical protein
MSTLTELYDPPTMPAALAKTHADSPAAVSRMNVNPKRNHHILPRLYLKGFVEEDGKPFIWQFKRGGPFNPGKHRLSNPRWMSIGSPAATPDYYAYPHASDKAAFEKIENLLMSFEQRSDLILAKIRSLQGITVDEKRVFAFYINQMNRRVPNYRKAQERNLPKVRAALEDEVREKFKLPNSEETTKLLERIMNKTESPDYIVKLHLDSIARTEDSKVAEAIAGMKWRFIVTTPELGFITSDNPMFYFEPLGLLNPSSEVSFPVSTTVSLVASQSAQFREGYSDASSQRVKELNRRTASRASQVAYFHRADSWVQTLLDKSGYKFRPTL